MAGDDVDIRVRATSAQAVRAFNDLKSRVDGLKGALVPLATAAVPVAAVLGATAVKAGGATLAVSAFGAAVAGQVSHLSAASEAQKAYDTAVVKSGKNSKQAAEAQRMMSATLAGMPEATARAAVGMQTLKGEFQDFSDGTAKFTMAPVEKSFTVLGQVIPRLTPMVLGASTQLERLVNVAGGAVVSPGFDTLSEKVSAFANESLRDAVTGIIRFSTALADGSADGPIKAFMDYAAQNGPAVRDTMANLGDAVVTLTEAAADAGPGMLTLVSAAAKLVASLPPELVTIAMQTAVGLKLMSLAGAGVAATAAGVRKLRDAMLALSAASAAAGGGVRGARAAIGSLSTAVKGGLVAAGIVAVAVGVGKLAEQARGAPPDVDKLVTSLKNLSRTGEFTGELKKSFGDLDGLVEDIGKVGKSAKDQEEYVKSFGNAGIGPLDDLRRGFHNLVDDFKDGEDSFKALEGRFGALDESFASMVDSGYAEQAAADFQLVKDAALAQGKSLSEVKEQFPEYLAGVASLKAEQQLAAEGMGFFGQAAIDTQAKLEAQKQSADGLRQSIMALNEVNRSAASAEIALEQAIDDASAAVAENGRTHDINTEAGRRNKSALLAVASAADEATSAELELSGSHVQAGKAADRGRAEFIKLAQGMGYSRGEAKRLADQMIKIPNVKRRVQADISQARGNVARIQQLLNSIKDKQVYVTTYYDTVGSPAASGSPEARRITKPQADGGVLEFYANGGTREQHVAQLAPAGTMRVWAEPETGGEAYIPLAASKRSRSMSVLEDVADRFGYGLEKFARGGVTKKEREARSQARGELTVSHFGRMAGYKNPEIRNQLGSADSLGDLVSSLNKWRSVIKKTTHGAEESRLLRWLNNTGKALIGQEKKLLKVNKALDKATDKLDSLKDSAAQLKGSVASGIVGGANITKAAGAEDSQVTINTLMSQMAGGAGNSKQFAGMLNSLKKKGLSGDLIAQIGEAGIEGGGMETAAAILGGGSAEIKQLNAFQKQITSAAGAAGKTASDAMYGAGIKAAEGLVSGLQKKQDSVEAQMMKIAKSMEKAIKKALGIKSPSKVMEPVGDFAMQGVEVGWEKRLAKGNTMLSGKTPAWASMLNVPRGASPAAGAGGSRTAAQPIIVHQTITLDGRVVARQIFDPLREEIAHRGGNVQQSMGRG